VSLTHPPTHCQRCGNGLPPHGTLDKLIMVGDRFFCFLCMHAYAEAAWKNDIHPGPITIDAFQGLNRWPNGGADAPFKGQNDDDPHPNIA
jgi:hypothetical protein